MALTALERQALVVENRGLAFAVMKALCVHRSGWQEAESEAMLALCVAASTYEPSKGAFSTWAWAKVVWALKTHMTRANRARHFTENAGRSTRRQLGGEEVLSFHQGFSIRPKTLDEKLSDNEDQSPDPFTTLENHETSHHISVALAGAKPMTRKVGLMAIEGYTKEEMAETLGVSVSTIARRRKEARELLRPLLEGL